MSPKKKITAEKKEKKENTGKYFIYGLIVAAAIFVIITLNDKGEDAADNIPVAPVHEWSQDADSAFVKSCYDKYRPQVKDDLQKQENSKSFCRCMLEKIKTKYSDEELYKMSSEDIKKWDSECRNKISGIGN